MGRSGTTWLGELINHRQGFRVLFEPFLAARVPEAAPFDYLAYIQPGDRQPDRIQAARAILRGEASGDWANKLAGSQHEGAVLLKDIRTNLMLAWLSEIEPAVRLVLLVRHPLQVTHSWVKLGWKKEAFGTRTNFETIVQQETLLRDFPLIREVAGRIDPDDLFQDVLFQWCVYHLVPLQQLTPGQVRVVFYEDLVLRPEPTLEMLFAYLGMPYGWDGLAAAWSRASSTNYLKRDHDRLSSAELVNSWVEEFSAGQIHWAMDLLDEFGLDGLYDDQGLPTGNLELLGR
jgi:hypothetical protein